MSGHGDPPLDLITAGATRCCATGWTSCIRGSGDRPGCRTRRHRWSRSASSPSRSLTRPWARSGSPSSFVAPIRT